MRFASVVRGLQKLRGRCVASRVFAVNRSILFFVVERGEEEEGEEDEEKEETYRREKQ